MIILKVIAQLDHYDQTYLHYYDLSIVFQWRGHDVISDLRSLNKKITYLHIVIVHGLTPHAEFQNHHSKTVCPSKGQSLTCITSIDLIWWLDLTWAWKFYRRCKRYSTEATENLVVLRLFYYVVICENFRLGLISLPPPHHHAMPFRSAQTIAGL